MQKKIDIENYTFLIKNQQHIFVKLENDFEKPYAQIYRMRYKDNLTVRQIAVRLNFSQSYVRLLINDINLVTYGLLLNG